MVHLQRTRFKAFGRISPWVYLATLTGVIGCVIVWQLFGGEIIHLFTDRQHAAEVVRAAGIWGPLIVIAMQAAQIIIAPIPGQVTGLLSGFLFGVTWGTIYAMIGTAIGFCTVFALSRQLGRPFVERFFDARTIAKFDYLTKTNGVWVFFLIFLLPAFPDDLVCYLAGLTTIRFSTLVIISLLGRFPGVLALTYVGSGAAASNMTVVVSLSVLAACIALGGYWQRARLEGWMRHLAR